RVKGGADVPLPQVHAGRIRAIAVQPKKADGPRWATADQKGNVFLWAGDGAAPPRLLRSGREAVSLAFTTSGRLFVGTNLSKTPSGGNAAFLELWGADTGQLIDEVSVGPQSPCFACSVDPEESR